MNPFASYPEGGQSLLGRRRGDTARRGYGLKLQQRTGQSTCAYCGIDLFSHYEQWLLLAVDHVIPYGEARRLGIPAEFADDMINLVLTCAGCNGFDNRYRVSHPPQKSWTVAEFVALRDLVFAERLARIAVCREKERAFYDTKPWIVKQSAPTLLPSTASDSNGTLVGLCGTGAGKVDNTM